MPPAEEKHETMRKNRPGQKSAPFCFNRRTAAWVVISLIALLIVTVAVAGLFMPPEAYAPDFANRHLAPSADHLFGTDYLGRDMFARTIKGLSTSILIGTIAAGMAAVIALILGILAASTGGYADRAVTFLVDLSMSVPHMIQLMLIAFLFGKGLRGVIIGVALTHWPSLTRVVRAEVMQVRSANYVAAAAKLGTGRMRIAYRHILPHVLPQFLTGLVLLFPHAIMHEAGITFLGFGLSVDTPAIGIILSEAQKHLATGNWWLVLFPGVLLMVVVMLFFRLGEYLQEMLNPASAQL